MTAREAIASRSFHFQTFINSEKLSIVTRPPKANSVKNPLCFSSWIPQFQQRQNFHLAGAKRKKKEESTQSRMKSKASPISQNGNFILDIFFHMTPKQNFQPSSQEREETELAILLIFLLLLYPSRLSSSLFPNVSYNWRNIFADIHARFFWWKWEEEKREQLVGNSWK